jgi:glycosyltransferase involved in cell wall biosynthesis
MKKRVLIFSFVYYPAFIGGAEVAIKEITDRIHASDISFDLIALRFDSRLPKYEKIRNVHVHRVGFTGDMKDSPDSVRGILNLNKYLYPLFALIKARKLHKEKPYDGIWSMMANYSGFGALLFKMLNPDVPYLLTLQEGDPLSYIKKRVGIFMPLFKRIFTKADFVQTISNYLADFARDMGYKGPLEVVPNGVDVRHFKSKISDSDVLRLRERLRLSLDEKVIITTSRLVKKNAVGDIISALSYLPNHVKLLILGRGYERAELEKLAFKEDTADRVVFLDYVPHEKMPYYLQIADVFVRPSLSEGFGNSFIEAMAAEVPVVATEVGGIPDFLIDPKSKLGKVTPTGFFAEVNNPKSIAEKVDRYLNNADERSIIVKNAKTMVEEKYDWIRIASEMQKKVFNPLLKV